MTLGQGKVKKGFLFLILQLLNLIGITNIALSESNTHDGITYLNYCKWSLKVLEGGHLNDQELAQSGNCIGYVTGYVDAHNLEMYGTTAGKDYCLPANGTYAQYIRTFIKYLSEHPEKGHEEIPVLLFSSFTKAYPCTK